MSGTNISAAAPADDRLTDNQLLDDRLLDDRLTVMGLLAETCAGLAARSAAQLAEHDLSTVEFEVMIRLARSPRGSLRMTDLSAQTSLTTSGVTRVVDRLLDRGLVIREACSTDRRTTYAVIGEGGRDRLAAALPGHLELIEMLLVSPLRAPADAGAAGLGPFVDSLRLLRDRLVPCATAGGGDAG